jgi:hypothetical protein
MPDFGQTKGDAMLAAMVGVNFAMAMQLARLTRDPVASVRWMKGVALRVVEDSAGELPAPTEDMAREIVVTIFPLL